MPTTQQLRSRLIDKLKELFQLDQPDLDFGFYRIMHAKSEQVTRFLEEDLLAIIGEAFGEVDDSRKTQLKAEYEKEVETAKEYGAADPETVPKVKEARERYETAQDTATAEGEIYDHLYRFFERYYDNGDFISRRYYTRETPGKAAPFAVPYNGEEVKLHWANADQYYIKTAEHFQNYTVDLRQAAEIREKRGKEDLFEPRMDANERESMKVHFRVVDASEGEHGNVKASEATKRYFIIHKDESVLLTDDGELVIQFEYRPDPEKSGQENTWRVKRNTEAVEVVLEVLKNRELTRIDANEGNNNSRSLASISGSEYLRLLTVPAPTDKDAKRPLLAKYINQYTARNTMDYFIHKDLGAFLRRELDFYIKNEVMRLDDIESSEAPAVETYLSKLKVLRTIAHKLIDFLAQLEDFQKRLWLKKKFVVETNYCITLDRIPEEFYAEIAANDAQREEWVRLFAIDEIENSTLGPGYSEPLKPEFLSANTGLLLDTRFFAPGFVESLVSEVDSLSSAEDGLLVHSENFQALSFLRARYQAAVQSTYIDPPYNTDASAIVYKNNYKDASWLALMQDRLLLSRLFSPDTGVLCVAIDDVEVAPLRLLLDHLYGREHFLGAAVVRSNPSGRSTPNGIAEAHDYALFVGQGAGSQVGRLPRSAKQLARYGEQDEEGRFEWVNFRKHGGVESTRASRPRMYYPLFAQGMDIRVPEIEWDADRREWRLMEEPRPDEEVVWPQSAEAEQKRWKWGVESVRKRLSDFCARPDQTGRTGVYMKSRIKEDGMLPVTWWDHKEYSATQYGTNLLSSMFGQIADFSFPKALRLVTDCLRVCCAHGDAVVLDFFGGSGTTAHATIQLNREDDGTRTYVLAEMGAYFDRVLRPRVMKAAYSKSWKDGKPVDRASGVSHCLKYVRLESYEDCLNNLALAEDETRDNALEKSADLREDYMLHYMLDVETRGSQSLLNIDAFADPTAYKLRVKKPGGDQYVTRNVDLIETFNYLIGLRVTHIAAPQEFTAEFERTKDPELPDDTQTRLRVKERIKQINHQPSTINHPTWWFRKVEGWVPADLNNPNNGERQKVLIVWRKLTGQIEEDNLMLDEWFQRNRISTRDFEFDVIYVNGSNNLPNLKQEGDNWKVRLIEEDFMRLMWDVEEV